MKTTHATQPTAIHTTRHKHMIAEADESATATTVGLADGLVEGLIVEGSMGRYRVAAPGGDLLCVIRGKLRKALTYAESAENAQAHKGGKSVRRVTVNEHDPVAVGDRVRARPLGAGEGVIEAVVARAGASFTRNDPDAGRHADDHRRAGPDDPGLRRPRASAASAPAGSLPGGG